MLSGKATSEPLAARSFYGESPPKRSRLHENSSSNSSNSSSGSGGNATTSNNIKPTLEDNQVTKFVLALGKTKSPEPQIKSSVELKKQNNGEETSALVPIVVHDEQGFHSSSPSAKNSNNNQLDRDSPIPLKNLGNTCYENSIIQCLFSLSMFMENFESSMKQMRHYVSKPKPKTFDVPLEDADQQDSPKTNMMTATSGTKSNITEEDVRYRIADAFDKLYKSYTQKRNQIETGTSQASDSSANAHQNNLDCTTTSINTKDSTEQLMPKPKPAISQQPISMTTTATTTTAIPLCKSYTTFTDETTTASTSSISSNNITKIGSIATTCTTKSIAPPTPPNLTPIALVSSSSTATTTTTTSPTTTTTNSNNEQSEIETRLEDLKSAVGERSSQFNSTHQQDASEFFYHVIDSIQEFYQDLDKTSDDDNPVTRAFELELDYLIRCPKCHHRNMSEPEKIRTLPLALPHVNNNNETNSSNNQDVYNRDSIGAPTPPTSDLGLDSPNSHTSTSSPDQQQRCNGSTDEKENQALVHDDDDDDELVPSNSNSSGGASLEDNTNNNTMSIAKLELTDKVVTSEKQQSPQQQTKHYTLCDALNNYFKDDLLEYSCSQPGCNSKQRTKKCLIRKLPQVLFITLARYSYTGKKNLDEIEAPFELTVPFRENKSPSHSPSAHRDFNNDDGLYQLVAVVCHLGSSLNAGHYTSYVYNQNNSSWYSCDDDSITKVQEADVKNDVRKTGYCFFYAHNSCINRKRQQEELGQHQEATNHLVQNGSSSRKDRVVHFDTATKVIDSSVVMTPESSPKSSPTPPPSRNREDHSNDENAWSHDNCANNSDKIDDWA